MKPDIRQTALSTLIAVITVAPVAAALIFRGRGNSSDYSPEWWKVMAVMALSAACSAIAMIASPRTTRRIMPAAALFGIAGAVCIQVAIGLCQIAKILPSGHSSFMLTGSFYNPGPFGGFIAMGLPIALSMLLGRCRRQQRIGYAVMLMILVALPASASRSAWVAAALSCSLVALCHFGRQTVAAWLRRWWLPLTVALIALSVGAYIMKADSANGRIFLWKIGLKACAAHPWGVGWHQVSGAYGAAQEAYFASGAATDGEIAVADAPSYLFNEYLQVALAWGWPAAAVFVAAIAASIIIAVRRHIYGAAGAMASFAIFAFASYPLQFPLFLSAVTTLSLGTLASTCANRYRVSLFAVVSATVAILSAISSHDHLRKAHSYTEWQKIQHFYRSADHSRAVSAMLPLQEQMKWNPRFMFELGHSLNLTGRPSESNLTLAEAAKVCADPMIFNLRGKNFEALGIYDAALTELRHAADRLPNRMYPHFLIVGLADSAEPVDTTLMLKAAGKVLNMPVKVMSPAIEEMRDSTRAILRRHSLTVPE